MTEVWVVKWCGGKCADNPHPTERAAQEWIKMMYSTAKTAGVKVYGSYSIHRETKP